MFRHQLIHDVAYDILPKATRRERHEAVARFIETRVASTELVAAILARHWREAGDTDRAIDYLLEAADVAGRGWEQREAIDLLKQALGLLAPGDVARRRTLMLQAALARQRYVHGVLDRAQILAQAEGDETPSHEH
jgi:predicted ATPase